jgi:hypothetical protein
MSLHCKPLERKFVLSRLQIHKVATTTRRRAAHLALEGSTSHARIATSLLGLLGEEAELALLGDVAHLTQTLDGLLASGLLAAGDNATTLSLYQILLGEATGSVLGSSVENFGLGTDRLDLATHHGTIVVAASVAAVLARVATSVCHFYPKRRFFIGH